VTPDLVNLTAAEAGRGIRERRFTPSDLIEALLSRIDRLEPDLRAWETVDAEGALKEARPLEAELNSSGPRSLLHGVPVAFKDIYFTAGLKTTMSSTVYSDFVPDHDAECVARLRQAGAIVLGKTVSTEFAMGDPSRTRNPWNAAHTAGGSSSGSAVAVASCMIPIAAGSQTAGSVNRPAAYNGVIGYKPTYGRVSRHGVFPVSWTLDTLGWMTRSVEDAALVLDAVSGYDARDAGSADVPPTRAGSGLAIPVVTTRIGMVAEFFEQHATPEAWAHTTSVAAKLLDAGAQIESFPLPASFDGIREAQVAIDYSECAAVHREKFRERPGDYAPNVRSRIESGALIPAPAYVQAQRLRRRFRIEMEQALQVFDAILTPAAPSPAPADLGTTGDPMFQAPWTTAGLPVVNLPTGLSSKGLPMGIQLIGNAFDDERLLATATWLERVLGVDLGLPAGVSGE